VSELLEIAAALRRAVDHGRPAALATVVAVAGSAFRRPGARMLIVGGERRAGTVSGGCLEADLTLRARRLRLDSPPALVHYDLRADDRPWGLGLGCEGAIDVLLEPLCSMPAWLAELEDRLRARREAVLLTWLGDGRRQVLDREPTGPFSLDAVAIERIVPALALWVFGAGTDARCVARTAAAAGFRTGVVDHRARRPEAGLAGLTIDARTAAVVMTHDYGLDLEWLDALLPSAAAYVGLLGPRRRGERLLAALAGRGKALTPGQRERVYSPAGLDLGGDGPEAIALSIVAEAHRVLARGTGVSLRDRPGPIHDLVDEPARRSA
jgi:xanthine/CO dehydrogenase XdhC/CoxF family maturation factor